MHPLAAVSQIFNPKLSSGFEERCGDLSWELEWARTLTLPISGTPLKSEVKGGSSEQRGHQYKTFLNPWAGEIKISRLAA